MVGTVRTPPSFFIPYISDKKVSEVDTFLADYVYAYNGESKLYMDKFGVRYKTLSDEDLTKLPRLIHGVNNPEMLAFFNHSSFKVYDNAAEHIITPDGVYDQDANGGEHTTRKFYFLDKPDEAIYHVLTPLLNEYDATNNKYGILDIDGCIYCGTDDDDVSFCYAKYLESTNFTGGTATILYKTAMLQLYLALYEQGAGHSLGDTSGFMNQSLTGSKLTADIDQTVWPLAVRNGAFYGTGLSQAVIENALLNYCISKAF
jgi:hypothetical protein